MPLNPGKFPLYRLPVIALQEVIKSMDLDVMFFFSLTSRKAKAMLKISIPKNYFRLKIFYLWDEKSITLKSPSSTEEWSLEFSNTVPDGSKTFQTRNVRFRYFTESFDTVNIHGNGPLEVMVRELITHLAESLNLPKISIDFQSEILPEAALELLNHVKNLSLPMVKIELGIENISAEVYTAFLNEGPRITKSLVMACGAEVGFQYTPSEEFRLERFEVEDGNWVNLEDYINCKRLIIHNIIRSDNMYFVNLQRKLNQFFKNWQRSGCRLEFFETYGLCHHFRGGINFDEVILGLNGTNITREELNNSVDIERQDGTKATIRLRHAYLTFEIKS